MVTSVLLGGSCREQNEAGEVGMITSILQMREQRLSEGRIPHPKSHRRWKEKTQACVHTHLTPPLTHPLSTVPDRRPSRPCMNPQ